MKGCTIQPLDYKVYKLNLHHLQLLFLTILEALESFHEDIAMQKY